MKIPNKWQSRIMHSVLWFFTCIIVADMGLSGAKYAHIALIFIFIVLHKAAAFVDGSMGS